MNPDGLWRKPQGSGFTLPPSFVIQQVSGVMGTGGRSTSTQISQYIEDVKVVHISETMLLYYRLRLLSSENCSFST
jgi:hypothetical protein